MAVADVYDALLAARPYRVGLPLEGVLAGLRKGAGAAVCGDCVRTVEQVVQRDGHVARAATALSTVANVA